MISKMPHHLYSLLLLSMFIFLGCTPQDFPITPTSVPMSTLALDTSFEGVYMPFQNGFMVYIEGNTCLYAYADSILLGGDVGEGSMYRYCLSFADLPIANQDNIIDPFGRIWAHYPHIRDALGVPTGDAIRYHADYPPAIEGAIMGSPYYSGITTLPDGAGFYCGARSATAGRCIIQPSQ